MIILFLLLFLPIPATAQRELYIYPTINTSPDTNFRSTIILGNKIHSGKIINNYLSYENYPKRKVAFLNEFYFGIKTRGSKNWHKQYKFPEIGASFFVGNLGNPEELGYTFGFVPNMNVEILRKKKLTLRGSIGIGIAYFNKPYDSISNQHNILIGSHFTNLSVFSLSLDKKISKKILFTTSISMIHASNGHFQIPNAGMNLPTASFGLKYFMVNDFEKVKTTIDESQKSKNIVKLNFQFGAGIHEFANTLAPIGTPKWTIYSGSLFVTYRKNNIHNYFAGVSTKYYTGFHDFITKNNYYNDNIQLKSTISTIFVGHEFLFGHFGLVSQMGYNFYNPFVVRRFKDNNHVDKIVFRKAIEIYTSFDLGLKYYFHETNYWTKSNFFVGATIKTYFFKADFIELSFGFTF